MVTSSPGITQRNVIVVLSHGSRHPQADPVIEDIAAEVARITGCDTRAAYLDFHPDTLTVVARRLAGENVTRVVVVPLLFSSAFHLNNDVPDAIAEAREDSGLDIVQAAAIGAESDVAALLAEDVAPGSEYVVVSVGSSIPGSNETIENLVHRAAQLAGARSSAAFVATGGTERNNRAAFLEYLRQASRSERKPLVIAPLFVAPGLLWDGLRDAAAEITPFAAIQPHLGTRLASIIRERVSAHLPSLLYEMPCC